MSTLNTIRVEVNLGEFIMKKRTGSISERASNAASAVKGSFLIAAATASARAKSFAKWANENISAFRTRCADYKTQFEKASTEKAEEVLDKATEDATKVIIAASAQAGQVLNAEEQKQVRASIRMSRGSKGFNPNVLKEIVEDTVKRMSLVREDEDDEIFGPNAKPFVSAPSAVRAQKPVLQQSKPPMPPRPSREVLEKKGITQQHGSTERSEVQSKRMSTRLPSVKLEQEQPGVHQPSVSEYSAEALKWARITQRDPKDYRANPLAGSTSVTLQKTMSTASVVKTSTAPKQESKTDLFAEMKGVKLKSSTTQEQDEKPKALSALEEAIAKRKQVVSAQMKKGGA